MPPAIRMTGGGMLFMASTVAWGIVPTHGFSGNESVDGLFSKLEEGLGRVHEWEVDSEMLAKRSVLTPACGMGTMDPATAKKGLDLLSRLSKKCKESVVG